MDEVRAVDVAQRLDENDLLQDSARKPGQPIRKFLRNNLQKFRSDAPMKKMVDGLFAEYINQFLDRIDDKPQMSWR